MSGSDNLLTIMYSICHKNEDGEEAALNYMIPLGHIQRHTKQMRLSEFPQEINVFDTICFDLIT